MKAKSCRIEKIFFYNSSNTNTWFVVDESESERLNEYNKSRSRSSFAKFSCKDQQENDDWNWLPRIFFI